jgi:hypothetical protein
MDNDKCDKAHADGGDHGLVADGMTVCAGGVEGI